MTHDLPTWRSLLYVPAHREKLVTGAHRRGADAIILDLEDGVPEGAKDAARDALIWAVLKVSAEGAEVVVRINKPWSRAWRDLEAAVAARAHAVLLPKVEHAAHVQVVAEYLGELEHAQACPPMRLLALVESARGLQRVRDIAEASPRLCALIPGNEDLATELRLEPDPEHMLPLHLPLLTAARAAGLLVLGTLGSLANFRDLTAYRERVTLSRDWGFEGATCIHPDQVRIINEVYRLSPTRLDQARKVVAAFEAASGEVVALDGVMIDKPVYSRAKRLLTRARVL